jgi:dTDP-4-amino-4,6-dideoxygalactose transaminase
MIPVFDIHRQNQKIEKELAFEIKKVVDGGYYILGPKVEEFEKAFADYLGVKYAIGVGNGTDALSLALLSVSVESGDEVILPANSYPTVFAVTAIGAVPKLIDIDPVTFNIDPDLIPQAISSKTKAIIPVHLYGQPADMKKIMDIGKRNKIPIIEDCAQAHGAEIIVRNPKYEFAGPAAQVSRISLQNHPAKQGSRPVKLHLEVPPSHHPQIMKKVGCFGEAGCFSFYPTKNLGCFGDGGMIVTNNEEIAKKARLLRMYGEEKRYRSVLLGRNSRLDELQAAILLVKLKYLDKWNNSRREIAGIYKDLISNFLSNIRNNPKKPLINLNIPTESKY